MAPLQRPSSLGAIAIGTLTIDSESASLLTVRFAGERRVHDAEKIEEQWEFWPKATQRCRQQGIRRVLILNELVGPISSNYVRNFHINLAQFGLDRELRYAMVVHDAHDRSVLRLGIDLAKDIGWDLGLFEDAEAATAWLARPFADESA